jgi:transposase
MQAADLFEQHEIPAEIARQVGVSHQIVSDWRTAWRQGGRDALRSAGRAGRKPKLSDAQLAAIVAALTRGAAANGYSTDLWTLARVAVVIERVSGVRYHPGHVWHLLRERLNWSRQRPARRASERNEAAIRQWVQRRWPQIKKELGATGR